MSQSTLAFNLKCVYLTLTCVLCVLLPFSTASIRSEDPTYEEFNKRDIGLRLCKTHARNCPGGYVLKRNGPIDSIWIPESPVSITQEERLRAEALLQAGEAVKSSFQNFRKAFRSKLHELLRPSYGESSEESKEV